MNPFRALLVLDVVLSAIGAALCLLTPQAFAAGYFSTPLDATATVFVRWLGLMFAVYVAILGRGLLVGDRHYWRTLLPAVALGDGMHVLAGLWRANLPDFRYTPTSVADMVLATAYFGLRIWLARHPERLDRRSRPG